jgi:hypothetical protein
MTRYRAADLAPEKYDFFTLINLEAQVFTAQQAIKYVA